MKLLLLLTVITITQSFIKFLLAMQLESKLFKINKGCEPFFFFNFCKGFFGMCVVIMFILTDSFVYISWPYQACLQSTEKLFLVVLFPKETLQFSLKVTDIYYFYESTMYHLTLSYKSYCLLKNLKMAYKM